MDAIVKKKIAEISDLHSFFEEDVSIQYINAFKRFFLNEINNNSKQFEEVCNFPFDTVISARWKKAIYECIGQSNKYAQNWFQIHHNELNLD